MKAHWVISIIATVLIWAAGGYAFYYVYDQVPNQLHAASKIVDSEATTVSSEPESKELKQIIHETQKLVLKIELADGSLGSGFLYNNQGDVITNAHVVAGAKDVKVKTADSREFSGTVIGISEETDVAVVRVEGLKGTEPLTINRDKEAEIGDEVLALGNPLGLENTVTTGIISGVERDFDLPPYHYEDVYQISAPIAPGNSGGPLIHSKTGEVLGINSAGTDQGSIGFSIPITSVIGLVEGWSNSPMQTLPYVDEYLDDYGYGYEEENSDYSDEDLALYLVNYFYESLDYEDYITAYSLLGSSWQSNTSYETFRNGYLNTASVTIDDLVVSTVDGKVKVVAIISAEERASGETVYKKYKVSYSIGYENDQMKLISGVGEAIN